MIRVSDQEYGEFKAEAHRLGIGAGTWIRMKAKEALEKIKRERGEG